MKTATSKEFRPTTSPLGKQIEKRFGNEGAVMYAQLIDNYRADVWFEVAEWNLEHVAIVHQLADNGLICRQTFPVWERGEYVGIRIHYLYNEWLQYPVAIQCQPLILVRGVNKSKKQGV